MYLRASCWISFVFFLKLIRGCLCFDRQVYYVYGRLCHIHVFVDRKRVLNESDGIERIGGVSWELVLCLIATWILVYLSLYNGVKSSGKVEQSIVTDLSLLLC